MSSNWKVLEYLDNNPNVSMIQAVKHFAEELEVDEQLDAMQVEADRILVIREKLRPLYGKKMDLEQKMALKESDFTGEVMIKYPPRKGSDKERKAYLDELKQGDDEFMAMKRDFNDAKDQISEHEADMEDVELRAKNARRIVETFNLYASFILHYFGQGETVKKADGAQNQNMF